MTLRGTHLRRRGPNPFAMRMRGLEPPRAYAHTDLNRARLPIPPHPRDGQCSRASGYPAYPSSLSMRAASSRGSACSLLGAARAWRPRARRGRGRRRARLAPARAGDRHSRVFSARRWHGRLDPRSADRRSYLKTRAAQQRLRGAISRAIPEPRPPPLPARLSTASPCRAAPPISPVSTGWPRSTRRHVPQMLDRSVPMIGAPASGRSAATRRAQG